MPRWEAVDRDSYGLTNTFRMWVPEGWIVTHHNRPVYVPDPNHEWRLDV